MFHDYELATPVFSMYNQINAPVQLASADRLYGHSLLGQQCCDQLLELQSGQRLQIELVLVIAHIVTSFPFEKSLSRR